MGSGKPGEREAGSGKREGGKLVLIRSRKDLGLRRKLPLGVADDGERDRSVLVDEEHGGARDVPCVEAGAVPDAVRARHVASLVDQDVEGEPGFLDVVAHGLAILREHAHHLDPPGGIGGNVGGELTEPVAALRSPGAPVEIQQQPAAREEIDEGARPPLLIPDEKAGSTRQR